MFKNVASQKIRVFAYDYTTGAPKTGDSANITAYVSKDYGAVTVLGDTSATESDATNAPGSYLFDLTQAETNADCLDFSAKSSTSNIRIVPITVYTDPPSYTSFVTPTNLTAAQIATGVWQDTTAGDFTTALSVGKSVMNGVALGTGLTVAAVSGAVGSVTGNVGGNVVGSVASVTAGVTLANNSVTAAALAADAGAEIADAILDRDMSTGADSGSTTVRTVRQALRFSRNKVSIAAGTMTVTKEDDATSSWTAAITTTAGDPITSIDPAGP